MSAPRGRWGTHASRVLVAASRRDALPAGCNPERTSDPDRPSEEVRFGGTPKPARETRALPGDVATRLLLSLLIAIGAFFAPPSTTRAATLRAEFAPLTPNPRSDAPLLVDVKLHWPGPSLLEGVLEVTLDGGSGPLFRQRTRELALATGTQAIRLTLPPPGDAGRWQQLDAQLRFVARHGTIELGRFPLAAEAFGARGFTIAVCGAAASPREGEPRLWQVLRLERFRPKSLNTQRGIVTAPVMLEPPDFPTAPLAWCAFDLVLLEGGGLARLRGRQLDALATWVEAGGSLCVAPDGVLQEEHLQFLHRLAGAQEPPFRLDEFGHLISARGPLIFARPELGRLVVAQQLPRSVAESETAAWRRATAFLWKLRAPRAEAAERDGAWDQAIDSALSFYAVQPNERDRDNAIENYLTVLLPQSARLIPLPVVGAILGAFVLLVGPGEWFVLGWLRRRRWTWVVFPIIAAGCTALTVRAAEHYLGSQNHRASVVIADVGRNGRVLRESRLELLFAVRDQEAATELRHSFCVPTRFAQQRDHYDPRGYSRLGLTVAEGQVPARWQLRQGLRQWTPQVNRQLSLETAPESSGIRWEAITAAELTSARQPAQLCAERIGTPGSSFVVLHRGVVRDATPLDRTGPAFVQALCTLPNTGFGALVSQIAPDGSGDLDDLPLHDGFDAKEWIVVAIQPGPGEVRISRRIYRTDE